MTPHQIALAALLRHLAASIERSHLSNVIADYPCAGSTVGVDPGGVFLSFVELRHPEVFGVEIVRLEVRFSHEIGGGNVATPPAPTLTAHDDPCAIVTGTAEDFIGGPLCLAHTVGGNAIPRCDQFPRCPCGGPDGWTFTADKRVAVPDPKTAFAAWVESEVVHGRPAGEIKGFLDVMIQDAGDASSKEDPAR